MTADMAATVTSERWRPPRRMEYATADPDEADAMLGELFHGARLSLHAPADANWNMNVRRVASAGVNITDVRLPSRLRYEFPASEDELVITTVRSGGIGMRREGTTTRYHCGDAFISMRPGAGWEGETDQLQAEVVGLAGYLLRSVTSSADASPSWPMLSSEPKPGGDRRWRWAVQFVRSVLAPPEAADSPLVVGAAERLLAATALTVFPGEAREGVAPAVAGERSTRTESLRLAIAFIEAGVERDIGLGEIAGAACVSPRALQLTFRRHLDTTPLAYLRQARLELAHAQLLGAEPGDGVTVTGVAYRWGFSSPSRFASYYQAAYGQKPREALRT